MWLVNLGAGIGHPVSIVAIAFAGLFNGYVAGKLGVGGGVMLTPLLIYGFCVPTPIAVGSALCQKCGTSISSILKYRSLGRGEPRIDFIMLGGSLIGVDAGTRLLSRLSTQGNCHFGHRTMPVVQVVLDILFIVLLTLTAIYTFHDAWVTRRGRCASLTDGAARSQALRGDVTVPGPLVTKVRIGPFIDLPNVQLKQV